MTNILDIAGAAGRVAISLVPKSHAASKASPASTGATAMAANATAPTTTLGPGITSKDFMTLLVTEMKNQDPTQPTDPNQYIQQLVGVNCLQQLIAINNDLGGSKKA